MNEIKEHLIERLLDDQKMIGNFERFRQRILKISPEQMTEFDRSMADYFSKGFPTNLEDARERQKDSIKLKQVAKMLGLTVNSIRGLPVPDRGAWSNTASGRRLVMCYRQSEVIAYMTSLYPSFADYSLDEPLLRPEDVVEVCKDCDAPISVRALARLRKDGGGPDHIQLGERAARYRLKDVLHWLQDPEKPLQQHQKIEKVPTSELIMKRL